MDDYPCWGELGPADQLRIVALEAELAGLPEPILEAIHVAAREKAKVISLAFATRRPMSFA